MLGSCFGTRRIIQRIHARQGDRERRRYPPVSVRDLMRFLLAWQHAAPGTRLRGVEGLAKVVDQLQGIEVAVGDWEGSVLPSHVEHYRPQLLDELCANGAVSWGRLSLRAASEVPRRARRHPLRDAGHPHPARGSRLAARHTRGSVSPAVPGEGASSEVLEALGQRGALFFGDLCEATARLPLEVADAIWDGVAPGLLTSDGFAALRHLLAGRYRSGSRSSGMPRRQLRRARRANVSPALAGGRWSALPQATEALDPDELAEAVAAQLLERWGVVCRDLVQRESLGLAWREVLFALRRLEARARAGAAASSRG